MRMDWDSGFSMNSPEFVLLEEEMEEFRSEKTVKSGKVSSRMELLQASGHAWRVNEQSELKERGTKKVRYSLLSTINQGRKSG